MSDYFLQDALIEILARLPVKSLLRFRSVCKFFNSTISSPSFISHHINATKHSICIPLVMYLAGGKVSRDQHYFVLPNMKKQDFYFKSIPLRDFKIVGTSNGLLCLSYGGIILLNPSIKKYIVVPKPRVTSSSYRVYRIVLGFGYDCKTDDYKVVRIAFPFKEEMYVAEVEIYSVKSGSWKDLYTGVPPPYLTSSFCYSSHAFVEGCVHWLGCDTNRNEKTILSFDMSNEEFKEVNLPNDLQEPRTNFVLGVIAEKLAAIVYHSQERYKFMVWVMEEYGVVESWSKMYDVDMRNECSAVVGFTNNGHVVVKVNANGDLIMYDPSNDMNITYFVVDGAKDPFHMEMYVESLVLLNEKSATSQYEAFKCGPNCGCTS